MDRKQALRQYDQFKAKYPDFILLFRLGDRYEAYCEDAVPVMRTIGAPLATTANTGREFMMATSVPVDAIQQCLRRLIAAGHKCAICEPTP